MERPVVVVVVNEVKQSVVDGAVVLVVYDQSQHVLTGAYTTRQCHHVELQHVVVRGNDVIVVARR